LIESDLTAKTNHDYDDLSHDDLVSICNTRGLDVVGSTETLRQRLIDRDHNATEVSPLSCPSSSCSSFRSLAQVFTNTPAAALTTPKKYREITIETLGLTPSKFTPAGVPMVSGEVLRGLAGKDLFGDRKSSSFLLRFPCS
jgi:hypothetical protein